MQVNVHQSDLVALAGKSHGEICRDPADSRVLLERQALHARRLRFVHPETSQTMDIEAPLPEDMAGVLAALREYRA